MPTHQQTVCLAMIVRDEADTIKRCLLAAKPYIDAWVIHDMGATDGTTAIIQSMLWDIPGRVEQHTMDNFSVARNKLLDSASESADLILMLDADEELQSLNDKISLSRKSNIAVVDIIHDKYTIRVPRLFRSNSLPKFRFPVAESINPNDQLQAEIANFSLIHHSDGIRHRQKTDIIANRFLIESVIGGNTDDPAQSLVLGQLELRKNKLSAAMRHFENVVHAGPDTGEFWQASYFAANIHALNGDNVRAIALFQDCFDSDPERPEPLMRMAELHHQHDENQIVQSLCEVIIDMPIADSADYFEQALYKYEAALLLAEAALANLDYQTLATQLETLNKIKELPANVSQRIDELKKVATKSTRDNNNHTHNRSTAHTTARQAAISGSENAPILTIGMATHDDFDGVYFSLISVVLYHKELLDQIELLVIDNNPESAHGKAVEGLCGRISQARYIAAGEYQGTAVRERVFAEARGAMVVCMDCHVFLHANAVSRLIDYFKNNPDSKDLLHGPLFYDNHDNYSTHMTPEWSEGFFGRWGSDPRGLEIDGKPFDIPLQGMGLFACTRQNWPGFNLRFRGFGGEEGYIHEKFRQRGGRVLCLPFLRWTHRFDRPNAPSYPNRWQDRIRNYLVGWHELGLDSKPVLDHFSEHLPGSQAASAQSSFLRELKGPLWQYDTVYLICDADETWQQAQLMLQALAIENITQRVNNISQIHRLLLTAQDRSLENIVLLDGAQISEAVPAAISAAVSSADDFVHDIIASKNNLDVSDLSQVTIIQSKAFQAASQCFKSHGSISMDLIHKIDKSITMSYIG